MVLNLALTVCSVVVAVVPVWPTVVPGVVTPHMTRDGGDIGLDVVTGVVSVTMGSCRHIYRCCC